MTAPRDRRVLIAFLAVVVLGGTNLVLVVKVARQLDPLWGAALRFLGAALLTLLAVGVLRAPLPRGRELLVSALYGVFAFTLGFGLFFWGTQRVPAGIASVIIGSVPLLTLLLGLSVGVRVFDAATRGAAVALDLDEQPALPTQRLNLAK